MRTVMNHYVPDFNIDDDYSIAATSTLTRPIKSAMHEDEIMELLWQNGQVVVQSQTQKSLKKSTSTKFEIQADPSTARERDQEQQHQNLFMQEDEMATWLHYPINDSNFDQDFCSDLVYPPPSVTASDNSLPPVRAIHSPEHRLPEIATTATTRPPLVQVTASEVQNFALFSRHHRHSAVESSMPKTIVRETTIVDSSEMPALVSTMRETDIRLSRTDASDGINRREFVNSFVAHPAACRDGTADIRDKTTGADLTTISSPEASTASADLPPVPVVGKHHPKRKSTELEEAKFDTSDEGEFESAVGKKQARGSASTKRSRAAEVHNLSERRRRDRINEKMKALQELIPRCNKSDKASMLDEAIEYLKSLQLQVQMMSMGYGMVPMMFPGVQQFLPAMGLGMGINRPVMPFPGAAFPASVAAAHMGPSFPMPAFHMPHVPPTDQTRVQAPNLSNPMINPQSAHHANQPQVPNFSDPYQYYFGHQHMQLPLSQNQAPQAIASTTKVSTSRVADNLEGQ